MLKSFLHQSSDVNKAISEAWEQSDCPSVFTVKILDVGKRGFLGFAHQPAKISFTYEQGNTQVVPGEQLKSVNAGNLPKNGQGDIEYMGMSVNHKPTPTKNHEQPLRENRSTVRANVPAAQPKVDAAKKPVENNEVAEVKKTRQQQPRRVKKPAGEETQQKTVTTPVSQQKVEQQVKSVVLESWTESLASQAADWLRDFCKTVNGQDATIEVLSLQQTQLALGLQLSEGNVDSPTVLNDNGALVNACAALIVQSLRNSNGLRLKGLQVKISLQK